MEITIAPNSRVVVRISLDYACALTELSELRLMYNKCSVNINILNLIL